MGFHPILLLETPISLKSGIQPANQFSEFGFLLGSLYKGGVLSWGPREGPYCRELPMYVSSKGIGVRVPM